MNALSKPASAEQAATSWDDHFFVTLFDDLGARTKHESYTSLEELKNSVGSAQAPSKDRLPLLKLARFGNATTGKGSLRHNENLRGISGVEGDYDSEEVGPDEAEMRLKAAGVEALIYTTPSHTPERPRWRVICPFSQERPPEQRDALVDRLNGALGGILAPESWVPSQAFYYGTAEGRHPAQPVAVEGAPIDLLDGLDAGAIGRPGGTSGEPRAAPPIETIFPTLGTTPPYARCGIGDTREWGFPLDLHALHSAVMAIPPEAWKDRDPWRNTLVAALAYAANVWPEYINELRRLLHEVSSRPGAFADRTFPGGYDDDARAANDAELDKATDDTRKRWGLGKPCVTAASLFDLAKQHGWNLQDADNEPAQAPKVAEAVTLFNAAELVRTMPRPRQWLFATTVLRGAYTLVTAPGGAGKTALLLAMALSLTTGRNLIGMHVHKRCKVLFISGEDGADELARRLRAAMQHFGVAPEDIDGWLYIVGAGEVPGLRLNALDARGRPVVDDEGFGALEALLIDTRADVAIFDPLMSFVPGGVNDNALASEVAGRLVSLCVRLNRAVVLSHHHSKAAARNGEGGDANAAMGAAGWSNHARVVCNLVPATAEDAGDWKVAPSETAGVFRLTDSKANLARKSADRTFKLEEVHLSNGTPDYPQGDRVQVAVPFTPPKGGSRFSEPLLRDVLGILARGASGGAPFSPSARSLARGYHEAVVGSVRVAFPDDDGGAHRALARRVIDDLLERGWVAIRDVALPRLGAGRGGGKSGPGVVVIWTATPWRSEPPPGPNVAEP